jgi:hypothetical protein
MIVEEHTAEVYCDCTDHPNNEPGVRNKPVVFAGSDKKSTDHQRKEAGWVRANGHDYCPVCKVRFLKNRPAKGASDAEALCREQAAEFERLRSDLADARLAIRAGSGRAWRELGEEDKCRVERAEREVVEAKGGSHE